METPVLQLYGTDPARDRFSVFGPAAPTWAGDLLVQLANMAEPADMYVFGEIGGEGFALTATFQRLVWPNRSPIELLTRVTELINEGITRPIIHRFTKRWLRLYGLGPVPPTRQPAPAAAAPAPATIERPATVDEVWERLAALPNRRRRLLNPNTELGFIWWLKLPQRGAVTAPVWGAESPFNFDRAGRRICPAPNYRAGRAHA